MPEQQTPLLRDAAGVIIAIVVVVAFISVGFLTAGAEVFIGVKATFPEAWLSSLLNMAIFALGYLLKAKIDTLVSSGNGQTDYQAALKHLPPGATLTTKTTAEVPQDGNEPAKIDPLAGMKR